MVKSLFHIDVAYRYYVSELKIQDNKVIFCFQVLSAYITKIIKKLCQVHSYIILDYKKNFDIIQL